MKKLLFVLAISGLAFTSCNSTGAKDKKAEAHSHEAGCTHNHDGHDHGTEGTEHHQEEFKVEAKKDSCCGSKKEACSESKKKACSESKEDAHDHEGHDHQH